MVGLVCPISNNMDLVTQWETYLYSYVQVAQHPVVCGNSYLRTYFIPVRTFMFPDQQISKVLPIVCKDSVVNKKLSLKPHLQGVKSVPTTSVRYLKDVLPRLFIPDNGPVGLF